MSMISAQVDELRAGAERLQDYGTFVGINGTKQTDPMMLDAANLMRRAADTIGELSAKCADLMDEHDEYTWTRGFMSYMAEHIRGDADVHNLADYIRNIETENADLRELARDMWLQLLNAYDAKELDEFAARMSDAGVIPREES